MGDSNAPFKTCHKGPASIFLQDVYLGVKDTYSSTNIGCCNCPCLPPRTLRLDSNTDNCTQA